MEKLVGAVQDTLESGARAIDSAINDINNAGTANPARHPQRLARLVAPQLLVIQSPVYRQLLISSSLIATKAAILAATLEFLRLARGAHRFPEDAEAFGGSTVSSDAAVNRLEAALAQVKVNINSAHYYHDLNLLQDTSQLPIFLALGLAYTATDPDPVEATALFRLFLTCRLAEGCARLQSCQPAQFWSQMGGIAVLGFIGTRVLNHLWTVWHFE